jgi:hypothetical protein
MLKRIFSRLESIHIWLIIGGWIALLAAVIWVLLPSQYRIGMRYTFDIDELFQINAVYHMRQGAFPYRDFLFPYTPIMQWILLPFTQTTSMMQTLETARLVAFVLYCARLIVTGIISVSLLGVPFGFLAVVGLLIDPFTVFSGLQFRPDTLAAVLESCAVLSFLWYRRKQATPAALVFGFFVGTMVVASLKSVPVAVGLGIGYVFFTKRQSFRSSLPMLIAALSPLCIFAGIMIHNGVLLQMLQAVVLDAKAINDSLLYPLQILNFYWPVNWYLYGYGFRSPLWYFEFLLPLTALSGIIVIFFGSIDTRVRHNILPLAVMALLQSGSLLFIRSIFIQYHLLSNWLLILLAVWFLKYLYGRIVSYHRLLVIPLIIGMCAAIYVLVTTEVTVNTERENTLSYDAEIADFANHHSHIPEGASVYPGLFWRTNGAYIGYGWNIGDLPKSVLAQQGGLEILRSKNTVHYLYLPAKQKELLPLHIQSYIDNNFTRHQKDADLWVRGTTDY